LLALDWVLIDDFDVTSCRLPCNLLLVSVGLAVVTFGFVLTGRRPLVFLVPL